MKATFIFGPRGSHYITQQVKATLYFIACLSLITCTVAYAHEAAYHKIERLNQEIKDRPQNIELYLQRAQEYHAVADWEKALADYLRISEINPRHRRLPYLRGLSLFKAGRYEESLKDFDAYLRHQPAEADVLIARARNLHRLGRHQEAYADYSSAIKALKKPPASLYLERANSLADAGRTVLAQAIKSLDEGIETHGPLVVLQAKVIELELKRKNHKAALNRLDQILTLVSRKESWLALRGEILEQADQPQAAKLAYSDAQKAIRNLPQAIRQKPATMTLAEKLKQKLHVLNAAREAQNHAALNKEG